MRFLSRTFRLYRPIAARQDCEIDGIKYKQGDYIDKSNHSYRSLKSAYTRKKIGHPLESLKKPITYKLEKEEKKSLIEIKRKGPVWCDVLIDGEVYNDKSLKYDDALKLVEELEDDNL